MSLGYFFNRLLKISLFLAIFIVQALMAQGSGTIRGTISDEITKEKLPGANVIVMGTSNGAATDLDGKFVIRNVSSGSRRLVITYIGYVPDTVTVNIPSGGTLEQAFSLRTTTLEGEEVVITAQGQGQISAIQQQLSSDKIANIVSEQRIQELPDFNAAQTISRLPGVSSTQSSGEDNKVVIRGLSPKYNSIEVEGVRLSSTGSSNIGLTSDTYVTTPGLSNDRSVDLTMISPYMIRMIAVYKSLTPDMNANSIGGTVNMELREAPADFHYSLMYQQGYTAKSGTFGNYRAIGSASDRFFDDNLGVYALINAESYDRNSDNLDAAYDIKAEGVGIDPLTGYRPVEVNTVSNNRHLETRQRYGGNLILDYNIPNGSIKFTNLLARINSDYTEHRQTINYDAGRMEWQLRVGENVTDQRLHSIKLDYDLDFLTADISASYTSSSNVLDKSPVINFNQTDALQAGVPRDNMKPEALTYLLTSFKGDSEVVLRSANLFSNNYQEEKYAYKADFEIPFNIIGDDVTGFLKFGGQYNNQSNSTDQEAPYLGFNGSATGTGTDIQSNLMRAIRNEFGISTNSRGELVGSSFLNSDGKLFDPFLDDKYGDIFYVSDPAILTDILNFVVGNPDFDASNSQASSGSVGGWYDGPYQQLTNDYKYKEDYYATYAMSRLNFLDFMLIGGVRYEKVESEYFAYNARDQRNAQSQIMYDTTSIQGNEFVLPMVQIKYDLFDWMDIRYAYTQTLARPDFNAISPKFTITQGQPGFIYTGNPELKPAKAYNHDLNLTFHNNELGLLTIGGFYKTVEDFVYTATYQLDAAQKVGIDSIARYTIIRNGAKVVVPNANATVIRPLNNPNDATIKGFELDFQHSLWYLPEPFNNIILGINYARIYSEISTPYFLTKPIPGTRPPQSTLVDSSSTDRLIDQANHVLNSYIGFDYEGFSTRLSFVYQDNSATANGGRYRENDAYTTDYFRVDFSARQMLPFFNMELFLDVGNLNNANTSGIQRSTGGFRNIQNYGAVGSLGIRMRY
jgi:TonB-dependent receptor